MSSLMALGLFTLGIVLLVIGAELLVRGASALAAAVGLSPLVIGLTVVAFGTSAPEMAVSVQAAYAGLADIAVANVVGSNTFNVLAILGLSAAVIPLAVASQLLKFDLPIMVIVSLLLCAIAYTLGEVGRGVGITFIVLLVAYTGTLIWLGRREAARESAASAARDEPAKPKASIGSMVLSVVFILVGLGLLVFGTHWLLEGATVLAKAMGVSDLVIGLTLVAAGTSLPELATSIVAAVRGQRDIAVGNVVGSNVFNILGVLGIAATLSPTAIVIAPQVLRVDLPVMLLVAIVAVPVFITGRVVSRVEGLLFIAAYVAYTIYLFAATG